MNRPRSWIRSLGLAVLLLIAVVPLVAYYRVYVQPAQQWAARIDGDTVASLGDIVERLATFELVGRLSQLDSETGGNPHEILRVMVEDELVRDMAGSLGIRVTEAEVDATLHERFLSRGARDSEQTRDQLERELQENYGRFLARGRMSDEEYRRLVLTEIYRARLEDELGERVPRVLEQVEIAWIRLPQDFENEQSLLTILRDQPFESIARRLNTETTYAAPSRPGYVGWVPKGAFPRLDKHLFTESVGQPRAGIVGPVFLPDGTYIINVIDGPEVREVEDLEMVAKLKEEALRRRLEEEWRRHNVEIRFNSQEYTWVLDRLEETLPASV